jgi:hypothetical protein
VHEDELWIQAFEASSANNEDESFNADAADANANDDDAANAAIGLFN